MAGVSIEVRPRMPRGIITSGGSRSDARHTTMSQLCWRVDCGALAMQRVG